MSETKSKVLKLKRVYVLSVYNNLRTTPPRDFPTAGEIKDTISTILPALKEHISTYAEMTTRAEALALKVSTKEIDEEGAKKAVDAINEEWREYTKQSGKDVCEVALSEEGFKTLRSQFEREAWGPKWTSNLDEYGEMAEAFAEAGK
ncbi:MAG: hypothetical protein A2X50_00280 [Candidatus Rokubacteria bacterium GWF2_70_14]|nr:MAG: hypothetical protein A2X50_00280 [Candidatus Rokubacteria bacterium GWF2_70_14]